MIVMPLLWHAASLCKSLKKSITLIYAFLFEMNELDLVRLKCADSEGLGREEAALLI
jgi:hypothetical protein